LAQQQILPVKVDYKPAVVHLSFEPGVPGINPGILEGLHPCIQHGELHLCKYRFAYIVKFQLKKTQFTLKLVE
jgi:hypothetical protein